MSAINPILPGQNPDPSICRVESDYFLAVSTFELFPGVGIYHSNNLVDWQLIGHALTRPSQLMIRGTEPGFGIWAPTIRYHDGRYYIATCISTGWGGGGKTPRGFYVWTDNIWEESSWSEPIYFDILGIDQDLFFDDDGKTYLSVAKVKNEGQPEPTWEAIWACEIDLASGKSLTSPVLLRRSTQGAGIAEGSHIFKRNGWYYLCVAEGGTEETHQEWIFRSKSPLGPFLEPETISNPIIHNDPHLPISCTGHADFVEGVDGQYWAVFLGLRKTSEGLAHLGRETFIAKVDWTEDGWPIINQNKPIEATVEGLPRPKNTLDWKDDFDTDRLSLGWCHCQTPFRQEYSLTERKGHLALYGNGYCIQDTQSPSMLLHRQTAFSGTWTVTLDFDPYDQYEEAGSTAYHSRYGYIAVLIRRSTSACGGKEILLRWTDKDHKPYKVSLSSGLSRETIKQLSNPGPVELQMVITPTSYICSYREEPSPAFIEIGTVSNQALHTPDIFGTQFTGTLLGVFAQKTNDTSCLAPAYFFKASFTAE